MKGHRATETPTATRFSIRVSVACRIIRERERERKRRILSTETRMESSYHLCEQSSEHLGEKD